MLEGSVRYLLSKNYSQSNNISTYLTCTINSKFNNLKPINHLFPDSFLVGHSDILPGVEGGKLPIQTDILEYKLEPTEQVFIEDI